MARASRFFGLSTGSLPANFQVQPFPHPKTRMKGRKRPCLTKRQVELIARHLKFYLSLANGTRQPTTAAQRRFVEVCRGRRRAATEHEVAFMRWQARR